MSNVTNLFDYKNDDPLIMEYITFFTKTCGYWLDQKSYERFHDAEVLNMFIRIRKLVPRSSELKAAYINFTVRFKDDSIH